MAQSIWYIAYPASAMAQVQCGIAVDGNTPENVALLLYTLLAKLDNLSVEGKSSSWYCICMKGYFRGHGIWSHQ